MVRIGSCNLGLFLKIDQSVIEPSEDPIGFYTGIFSEGYGPYMFEVSSGATKLNIDGTPNSDHPMTCFGRMNDDIYDNNYNVRFRADGAIIVIRRIFPGDELLIDYGEGYNDEWDWIRQLALTALVSHISDNFTFITDVSKSITLKDIKSSNNPLLTYIKSIIYSEAWTENMHSLTIQPSNDPTGLGLFLSSGVTFEKYKFGGWGSGKIFPEVLQKRGQSVFFAILGTKHALPQLTHPYYSLRSEKIMGRSGN